MIKLRDEEARSLGARPIPFAPGYYVTSTGVVFSAKRRRKDLPLRRLRPGRHPQGYPLYGLCIGTRVKTIAAHRIVALVFLPPRPSRKHNVRHLDGDAANNDVSNLVWGTQRENIHDKWRHGTMACGRRNGRFTHPESTPRGSACVAAKLSERQVREIRRRLARGDLGVDLAREFGVVKTTISAIKRGQNWKHL